MKFLIVLFGIATVASAIEQQIFKIPPESLTKLHNIAMACVERFGVDPSLIRQIGGPVFPRDDASSNFLHCYAQNSNFVDENGHVNVDKITRVLGDHPLKEDVKKAFAKCNEETMETPLATTVAMHKCYIETSPLIYEF